MGNSKSKKIKEPCLHLRDNSIIQVNKGFVDLTGFSIEELLGKTLIEIGAMIRINSQIHLDNISSKYTGYIFTKSLKVREITISIFHDKEANEQVYTFVEKPNSVLNDMA